MRNWVLVIEDDAAIAELVADALEQEGLAARCAVGWRALQLAEEEQPVLILLDMMLPGLNGPAILGALQYVPATRRIPVVVMTAMRNVRPTVIGLGAQSVLEKPFDLAELIGTVRQALESAKRGNDDRADDDRASNDC